MRSLCRILTKKFSCILLWSWGREGDREQGDVLPTIRDLCGWEKRRRPRKSTTRGSTLWKGRGKHRIVSGRRRKPESCHQRRRSFGRNGNRTRTQGGDPRTSGTQTKRVVSLVGPSLRDKVDKRFVPTLGELPSRTGGKASHVVPDRDHPRDICRQDVTSHPAPVPSHTHTDPSPECTVDEDTLFRSLITKPHRKSGGAQGVGGEGTRGDVPHRILPTGLSPEKCGRHEG